MLKVFNVPTMEFFLMPSVLILTFPLPDFLELSSYTNNFIAFFCNCKLCQGTKSFDLQLWQLQVP